MNTPWLTRAVVTLAAFVPILGGEQRSRAAERPNIVVILADDVGYGDLSCYGATRIKTPNLDRLAAAGRRFTDGHAPAATCTPTRYALLTGQYAWRRPPSETNILSGVAPLSIRPSQLTLPALLHRAGYATGAVGKWHLGLGETRTNYNHAIKPGPLEIGFDYFFGLPATGDRVPCVYVEGRRVVGYDAKDPLRVSYEHKVGDEPTGRENPDLLTLKPSKGHDATIVNGISRIGWMAGGKAARWKDEDMADVLTGKAVGFIEKNRERPFFLYFATHDVHVPRVPHARFRGKSGCGVRGDAVQQLDWCVGEVMRTLDRLKLTDRTLVIFASDNGPVLDDGYQDGAVRDAHGHQPSGPLRGGKYSPYEGGTRVPFIARWPGKVRPGVSGELVCLVDLLASCAALVGKELPPDAGPDSCNVLPALLGEGKGRDHLIEQARVLSVRKGSWKFVPRVRKGGAAGELYNLTDDLKEEHNLASQHPDRVKELAALLAEVRAKGRSRP